MMSIGAPCSFATVSRGCSKRAVAALPTKPPLSCVLAARSFAINVSPPSQRSIAAEFALERAATAGASWAVTEHRYMQHLLSPQLCVLQREESLQKSKQRTQKLDHHTIT